VNIKKLREEYKLWNFSLNRFLHSFVNSSVFSIKFPFRMHFQTLWIHALPTAHVQLLSVSTRQQNRGSENSNTKHGCHNNKWRWDEYIIIHEYNAILPSKHTLLFYLLT
jgi:hypothetical protein